ncbi:MAG: hypothetical protein SH856_07150 [Flavobacteriales bacterium]|nr:hypothetical protein [Flavobacteriales bacterium]
MITKAKLGRPSAQPPRLKNGYYVSVKSRGVLVMMHSNTEEDMHITAERYRELPGKDVVIMGEHLNHEWVSARKPARKKKEKAEE